MSEVPSTSQPSEAPAKGKAQKGKKAAAAPAAPPPEKFKPAKYGTYEKQVVDYVRTATARNIWYYRCD